MMVLIVALALLAPAPAAVPPAPPVATTATAAISEAAIGEALKMLDAEEFERQLIEQTDVVVEGMLALQVEQMRKRSEQPIPDKLIAALSQALRDHARDTYKANMPALKRQAAEIYAREFTIEELQRLRVIAGDPVIAKQRARGQALNAQLMMIGVNVMRETEDELEAKIEQVVRNYLKESGLEADDKS